jgi:hypothetical protein
MRAVFVAIRFVQAFRMAAVTGSTPAAIPSGSMLVLSFRMRS